MLCGRAGLMRYTLEEGWSPYTGPNPRELGSLIEIDQFNLNNFRAGAS